MLTISNKSRILGVVSFAFSIFAFAPMVKANTIELAPVADSIVLDGSSSVNPYPGLLASELNTSGAGSVWLSLLKFDLSSLTQVQINSATLELTTIFNHNSNVFSHQVFSSSNDNWSESTINGVNRPADSTLTLLSATGIDGVSQAYSWDVLGGVTGVDGLAGTGNMLTLVLRPDLSQSSSTFGPHFNDRSVLNGAPRLSLNVSAIPEPATWWLLSVGIIIVLLRTKSKK